MIIEQHIEELRAELRNAVDPVERRWIVAELEVLMAEDDGLVDAEPPF